ncbi:MAG TPA: DUF4011 domain-containing protein [Nocardioides sp.]|uniref:DUF4011 domain-containing protein n=1 Tax=Nocardioides sp. TaxID=35761 RepID=UPI002ED9C09C
MTVSISFSALEAISYALAHNQRNVVTDVALTTSEDHRGAELKIEICDDEGPVSHAYSRVVDLAAEQVVNIPEPAVRLDPAALLQNKERRPGWVIVSVIVDGQPIAQARKDVLILAGNQWQSRPSGLAMEMLAAYVMPNDPAISSLLGEATVHLERQTGRSALDGYQSGDSDRIDAIVGSIWEAARARSVRYAEPPASWADQGQKIRTPAEVLEGGLGTCLDTSVTLAAALEQAGVRPLLWVIRGHAFIGYWRVEGSLDAVMYADADDLLNLLDVGVIRLVETTMITDDHDNARFPDTHGAAAKHIADPTVVQAVVDVVQARQSGILPLPSRRILNDGTVQIVEYQPASAADRKLVIEYVGDRPSAAAVDDAPTRIQQWKNSLLDLSLRNRLINYTDTAGVRLRVPESMIGQVEDLISAQKPITLRPVDQIDEIDRSRGIADATTLPEERIRQLVIDKQCLFTNVTDAAYLTRMRGIAYKARTLEEETGANNLYLALGSLTWSLDGRQLRSPLILIPVRLTALSRGSAYRIAIDESGGSTPNFCLLEKLRTTFGLQIPGLANPVEDNSGIDIPAALEATRLAIAEQGLPMRVQETADLSILQFAKFRLWKDLDENWRALMANSLVKHLVETPVEPYEDPTPAPQSVDLDALDAVSPVAADASQLEAVAEAVAGRTFVLEGPPGTGKSQTITNLLTRAVAEGKRVLFVAEKRAALDVVSSRLDAVGMGIFSLDLHDKASKPAVVRAQIKQALDHAVALDEQGLASNEEDLRSSRRVLARYADRLHEKNPVGLSFYSARTQLLTLGEDRPRLDVPASVLADPALYRQLAETLRHLPDAADLARPAANHPWRFVGLTSVEPLQVSAIRDAGQQVDQALGRLRATPALRDPLHAAATLSDLEALERLARGAASLGALDATRTDSWRSARDRFLQNLDAFTSAAHPALDVLTPSALDLPIDRIHSDARAAEAAGLFSRGRRRKAIAAELAPAIRPGATVKPRRVLELTTALAQLRDGVCDLISRGTAIEGIELPEDWNPFEPAAKATLLAQFDWLQTAGTAVDPATARPFTAALRTWLTQGGSVPAETVDALRSLVESFGTVSTSTAADPEEVRRWSGAMGLVARWEQSSARRQLDDIELLSLRRWVAFNAALEPLRTAGMHGAATALADGEIDADDAVQSFERGVAAASLQERRTAVGMDGFDALAHDKTVARFTSSLALARGLMTSVVPSRVLSARPFQAASGRGRVGELQRELGRQRGGLGVRKLMQNYGDLIVQLMPCVLVSPDSVARFFPVGAQTFDLVVFDEASQIRVADAIGAMGRARSVVVVGDSKQMPPTAFAESSSDRDDDDEAQAYVVDDAESILKEAVDARVPQRWLTWHYRSQDESLIAFSNVHYYDSKLSSFPAPVKASADRLASGRGISLVRVDGTFQRHAKGKLLRTNPVEADAIVADVARRFDASPDVAPSLGVVTFNQQQRTYIEGLIRDHANDRLAEALDGPNGEGLFIKNLENVQGDERDVILFSTAFSVNDKGVLPLNFGPLTRAGGERRLNVAVTRARRQVVIFSSFEPEQIRVEQTQSLGIAHLRTYMEVAARGASVLESSGRISALPDRHRDQIAERLRAAGLIVATDVGLSDFRVDIALFKDEDPEQPAVAVLLDGPSWARRRTVGDRDGLPVDVLAKLMHWPAVERIWMPTWLADPEGVVARLLEVTKNARIAEPPARPVALSASVSPNVPSPSRASAVAAPVSAPALTVDVPIRSVSVLPAAPTTLPGETSFSAFTARPVGGRWVLDGLPGRTEADAVRHVIREVVETEGPVHFERLARQVAACFELTKLTQNRIDSIVRQIPAELQKDQEPFAWPPDKAPREWKGFRTEEEPVRPLEHLSLHELSNAMVALCRDAAGMSGAELASETLALFGWKRRTAAALARLDAALEFAVREGELRLSGDGQRYEVSGPSVSGSSV